MRIDARRIVSGRGLLVTVVAAGVVAGGGAATAFAAAQDGEPRTTAPSGDPRPETAVTATEAAAAALKAVPGKVAELELDDEDGKAAWEIGVLADGGGRRDVTVDSGTGKVLSDTADRPDDDDGRDQAGETAALRKAGITAADAAGAALKAVPGTVTSVDFEREHGKAVWEVDVTGRDGAEHELAVDAATAKVLADQSGGDD